MTYFSIYILVMQYDTKRADKYQPKQKLNGKIHYHDRRNYLVIKFNKFIPAASSTCFYKQFFFTICENKINILQSKQTKHQENG